VTVHVVARCVHGLEWVCADEVDERLPDAGRIGLARREVTFRLPSVSPALLDLRTVDDVFLMVGSVPGSTPDDMAAALRRLPWEEPVADVGAVRALPAAPLLDVVAAVEGRRRLTRFHVEHGVGPLLAARLGGRYLRRTVEGREPGEPDLTVRVAVRDETVTASVRLAARPLHRRCWKLDSGPGTLHPPLAAALVRIADPAPGQAVLDPFCGDGTVVIEAALARPDAHVAGRDLDPDRLGNAARNAERAGVTVTLERADAGGPAGAAADAVVTNPPWNLAVDGAGTLRHGMGPFWRRLPDVLSPGGRFVAVAAAELDVPSALAAAGLPPELSTRVRLAGRVSDVVVATRGRPALSSRLRTWRERAVAAGVGLDPPD
jgi:23S rRNA G2445 N2-methylase RlmL